MARTTDQSSDTLTEERPEKPVRRKRTAATKKGKAQSNSGRKNITGPQHTPKQQKTDRQETGKKNTGKKNTGKKNKDPKTGKPTKKPFLARLKRYALIALVLIIAYPVVLTLVYKIPFVRPISNHMVYEAIFGHGASRQWLNLEEISPNLRRSVIMSEDGQYCRHHGVDWGAIREVVEEAFAGETPRGASTITMQTAKNLFLWNGRSYIRKGLEIPLAIWLDFALGKKRVMEIYLNIAEWDKGKFGVQEGAKSYFGRSAKDLTRMQAALLAVTLPNPVGRHAAKPTRNMRRVARIVERRARNSAFYVQCVFEGKK